MELGLRDKVAMVSGASQGLGFGVARALAKEGAHLAIASRDESRITQAAERLRAETGVTVLGTVADVRDPKAIAG